jgi:hypothetical protein
MADRAAFDLAFKAQSGRNAPETSGLKYLPKVSWNSGITFNRVQAQTSQVSRFSTPGRAGTVPVNPTLTVEFAPTCYDVLLAAAFQNSWSTNTLTQGSTRQYFTFEDRQTDATSYVVYEDAEINSLSLNFQPNGLVETTIELLAENVSISGTATGSPVAADTHAPYDTWSGSLTYAGGGVTVTSLRVTFSNNFENRYAVFAGRFPDRKIRNLDAVSGEMTLSYANRDRLDDALDGTTNALEFVMAFGGLSHTFTFPAVSTTGWDAPVSTDPERLQTFQFDAGLSSGTKCTVVRDVTP